MKSQSRAHTAEQAKRRLPVNAYLAFLLLCALLFTGVSFARYVATGGAGDGARVAAFVVSANAPSGGLELNCDTGPYVQSRSIWVTNTSGGKTSKVAMRYDVIVTLDSALPAGVTLTLDGNAGIPLGNTYTFLNAGVLAGGTSQTNPHTLTFSAPNPSIVTSGATVAVSVSVQAQQIN